MAKYTEEVDYNKERDHAIDLLVGRGYICDILPYEKPLTTNELLDRALLEQTVYVVDNPKKKVAVPFTADSLLTGIDIFKDISAGKKEIYDSNPNTLLMRRLMIHLLDNPNTWAAIITYDEVSKFVRMSSSQAFNVECMPLMYEGLLGVELPNISNVLPVKERTGSKLYEVHLPDIAELGVILIHPDVTWDD